MNAEKSDVPQAMARRPVASWASIFLDYFHSKARLLAVESREATGHFIGLLVLLGIMLVLALCSVLTYGAFLLYLVGLLFHLAWGWSALICGLILTLLSILTFFLLRVRLRKPVFQTTLKDLEKDKAWLIQSKTRLPNRTVGRGSPKNGDSGERVKEGLQRYQSHESLCSEVSLALDYGCRAHCFSVLSPARPS